MATAVRAPNKVQWSMDEAIEHDAAIADNINEILALIEDERRQAKQRYDTKAQLRMADAVAALARLQQASGRLATLHRLARINEYDRR